MDALRSQRQLERDEGRRKTPYQDTEGYWSIGIGHCFGSKDYLCVPKQFWNGMSDDDINALFAADFSHMMALLSTYLPWHTTLPDVYVGVLMNMGFNLGVPGLVMFNQFLDFMKAGRFAEAAADLANTKVAHQLPERYGRLCEQLKTGQWM